MTNENKNVLNLINKLPDYMVEELQEANFLPYRRNTIETLICFFNKNLNLSSIDLGYTDEVSNVIEMLYEEIKN